VPRLAHQFPVEVVVAAVTEAVEDVEVGIVVAMDVLVDVGVDVIVDGDVVLVVWEEQEANTSETAIVYVSTMQITPFFT